MKCRDFRWYIENKVPSLASPAIIGSGEVRNYHHQFCLDQQDGDNNVGLPVLVFDYTGLKGNQYWYYRSGESGEEGGHSYNHKGSPLHAQNLYYIVCTVKHRTRII